MVTLFSFFVHEIPNGINDKANLPAKSLFWNTISMPLIVIKQLRIPPFTFPLSIIAFILIIFIIYISSICSICNFTCVSFRLLSQASFMLMSERSELHLLSKQGSATRTLRCKFLEGCWRHCSWSLLLHTWLNAWLSYIGLLSWLLCSHIRLSCSCCQWVWSWLCWLRSCNTCLCSWLI